MDNTAITVPGLLQKKRLGQKITMVTAYNYPMARLVEQAGLDIAFVGDSLGREELGYDSELSVTMEDILHHTKAVRRGVRCSLLLVDMPFLSHQVSLEDAVRNAGRLMQEGGAQAVKLEGGVSAAPAIRRISESGIPVMGHVGFMPQSVHQLGVRMQGKDEAGAQRILDDAQAVQDAGAFAVVLELIPRDLAARITQSLQIPTIGVGAGPHCDGQVLVISDLLALRGGDHVPYRHVKEYAHIGDEVVRALRDYRSEVEQGKFPK